MQITGFAYTKKFRAEVESLDPDTRSALQEALKLLLENPQARRLRLHPLSGYGKPTIWKIDVYSNHSWQVTFELNGTVASLKRVATHSKIDRDPRGE